MSSSVYQFSLCAADTFRVRDGVALDDDISPDTAFILDDIYRFQPPQVYQDAATDGTTIWLDNSDAALKTRCALTFMTAQGQQIRVFVLVPDADAAYLYADGSLRPGEDYRLIAHQACDDAAFCTDVMSGLVSMDAEVLLADGTTRRAADLRSGDALQTRSGNHCAVRSVERGNMRMPILTVTVGSDGQRIDLPVHAHQRILEGGYLLRAEDIVQNHAVSGRRHPPTIMIKLHCTQNAQINLSGTWVEAHLSDRRHVVTDQPAVATGRVMKGL